MTNAMMCVWVNSVSNKEYWVSDHSFLRTREKKRRKAAGIHRSLQRIVVATNIRSMSLQAAQLLYSVSGGLHGRFAMLILLVSKPLSVFQVDFIGRKRGDVLQ